MPKKGKENRKMRKDIDEKIEEMLRQEGAENIRHYSLVSNSGFAFDLNGEHYDLRHWRNVYGCEVDYWSCCGNEAITAKAEEINRNGR